jgi:ArsR family transcriptional regulator, arsenate/arsenite/antimonite-responsive transcriptional repressor / arsenate reductase (thioredoxin)
MIATAGHGESSPPQFLRLAGHPLRWQLLSELARSDRRVGELCALAGRRQSLVSYHLRQLRDGGLVSMRRSAADGRDTYYVLDLARCGELLSSAGDQEDRGIAPPADRLGADVRAAADANSRHSAGQIDRGRSKVGKTSAPKVTISLGRTLEKPLVAICEWAMEHLDELREARATHTRVGAR